MGELTTMTHPLRSVTKEFAARGPMQQFRLYAASAFHCFRCVVDKRAKLVTVYHGDWSRLLCNGCYGRLLSIHEIKAGTAPDDERAEALANLLLNLISKDAQDASIKHLRISERRADYLSERALRFLATSEAVSKILTAEPGLDWSPAVIGLCKAVECEVQARLLVPLRSVVSGKALDGELKNRNLRRVALFCSDPSAHPPELGPVRFFLMEVAAQTASTGSDLLTAFRRLVLDWPGQIGSSLLMGFRPALNHSQHGSEIRQLTLMSLGQKRMQSATPSRLEKRAFFGDS
jgi:hypothetical protein